MEILLAFLGSWPLAALVFGIVAIALFRAPLLALLHRADQVRVGGVTISGKAEGQQHADVPPQISQVEQLSKAMQGAMLTELEQTNRNNLDQLSKNPDEREKVLLKLLSVNQIAVAFERAYRSIFGTQLAALQWLVSCVPLLQDAKLLEPFYNAGKTANSDFYETYSFKDWLSYLESNLLIVHKDDKVGITVRGKEFLKYIIDQNYTMNRNG